MILTKDNIKVGMKVRWIDKHYVAEEYIIDSVSIDRFAIIVTFSSLYSQLVGQKYSDNRYSKYEIIRIIKNTPKDVL